MEKSNLIVLDEQRRPKRGTFEISTSGIDEALQGIGADPFGGSSSVGLRIPSLSTAAAAAASGISPRNCRYLFILAIFSLPEDARARIVGFRQLLKLGYKQPSNAEDSGMPYVAEQLVTDPSWHPPDANVSFHIHRLGPPSSQGYPIASPSPQDLRNFARIWTTGPALLYQTATLPALDQYYVDLTSYTPPNNGRPWGVPLKSEMGTFLDQRTEWRTHGGPHSLDAAIEGPCTIAMYASVRQTDISTRSTLLPPTTFYPGGMSDEDQFTLNFPNYLYWRVGGSLIVEVE